jgi:hypothetical protein
LPVVLEELMLGRGVVQVLVLVWASPAPAVEYMSIADAVKRFVPTGDQVVKVSKALTGEQKKRIADDYGWVPADGKYTFYVGKNGGERTAYVYIQPELLGTCFHKYAVGMKPDGEVIDTVVVELSCPRATPTNKKTFLKQYRGKQHTDPLTIHKDIDAVTGATLSSEVASVATRKAVSLHNLLFGGGRPADTSEDVRRARAAGVARIQRALASGELVEK